MCCNSKFLTSMVLCANFASENPNYQRHETDTDYRKRRKFQRRKLRPPRRHQGLCSQEFAPGQQTGFLHTHKNHEELYFFLAGKGEFKVDGKVFPVEEGSVVRVAPDGKRSVRNIGAEPLVMLCVQYRGNTFTAEDAHDGNILPDPVRW